MTLINVETIKAYKETHFNVFASESFILKIDNFSNELFNFYILNSLSCCAFITACNPYGEVESDERNIQLQEVLEKYLLQNKIFYLYGEGKHPSGNWKGEASFLVFGLGIDKSIKLGNELKQNAIVWCDSNAVPKLILLR